MSMVMIARGTWLEIDARATDSALKVPVPMVKWPRKPAASVVVA
jgi:hypothetical protein